MLKAESEHVGWSAGRYGEARIGAWSFIQTSTHSSMVQENDNKVCQVRK